MEREKDGVQAGASSITGMAVPGFGGRDRSSGVLSPPDGTRCGFAHVRPAEGRAAARLGLKNASHVPPSPETKGEQLRQAQEKLETPMGFIPAPRRAFGVGARSSDRC